ncbi:MAG: Xaa-Pro dipeptidase [Candidatus Tectimicrobiota bacterium]|nr:MAG: Xaa-Pro dipeptidase [Candidatus Tectomicrobia bacterium]
MRLVLRAARLIDGTGAPPRPEAAVLVAGDTIRGLHFGPTLPPAWQEGARLLDYPGCTLLPGLIDAHVHLVWGGTADPVGDLQRENNAHLLLRAADNARLALFSGVTTVRDCGGRDDTTFVVRDALQRGLIPGPRLRVCGRPLTRPGGHCFFFHGEAEGVEGVRRAVAQLVAEGADFIKVMATGGAMTPTTNPGEASYSLEELQAIVEAAAAAGRTVAAHCHALAGIERAVTAGCQTIEHASFLTPDRRVQFEPRLAARLVERGTYLVPTLAAGYHRARALQRRPTRTPEETRLLEMRARRLELFHRLYQMGARLVYGSDSGVTLTPFGEPLVGLRLLEQLGMPPLAVLHAATGLAAAALDIADTVGTLAVGKKADLLVVAGDPSRDLGALQQLRLVMLGGQVVVPHRPVHWQEPEG